MCGVAGYLDIVNIKDAPLRQMVASLSHRGPDDSGEWSDLDAGIALGHTRLSILDVSSAGHQPMSSVSGRYVITFNGEIYNHLELRQRFPDTVWRGQSDTETLLSCFDAWGIETTLKRLIGMFAFALWDRDKRILTLSRDRLGEKPLYYGQQGNTFLFGSELKALTAHPSFRADIDRNALELFLLHGYIPAPYTIYKGISKLPPGTYLQVSANQPVDSQPLSYWRLEDVVSRGQATLYSGTEIEAIASLEKCLLQAVKSQQISDVPIGAFLSGGIDSSTIVALMQSRSSRPINTFTIGFGDPQYNEAIYAKEIAKHLGTCHTELYVTPPDAQAIIPRLPTLYDEPFADVSQIPTYLVSQLARQSVTVSLSGDGGDELLGGYNRYRWTKDILRLPKGIRRLLAAGLKQLNPHQWQRVYDVCQVFLPNGLRVNLPGDRAHKLADVIGLPDAFSIYQSLVSAWPVSTTLVRGSRPVSTWEEASAKFAHLIELEQQMMAVDTVTYLPGDILCKIDRAAMGVSLETRAPYLDHRVVEFAWRLPLHFKVRNGQTKWLLKQLLYQYVPASLFERPKMGFDIPIHDWLRGPLRDWAEDLLDETRIQQEGYLHSEPIIQRWQEHLSGKRNWQYSLWHVLMFQSWLRSHN